MARKRVDHFTVRGTGAFPLDMLRYDRCYPGTGQDSYAAERVDRGEREVTLATAIASRAENYPTTGRWESFGWKVVAINGERL